MRRMFLFSRRGLRFAIRRAARAIRRTLRTERRCILFRCETPAVWLGCFRNLALSADVALSSFALSWAMEPCLCAFSRAVLAFLAEPSLAIRVLSRNNACLRRNTAAALAAVAAFFAAAALASFSFMSDFTLAVALRVFSCALARMALTFAFASA